MSESREQPTAVFPTVLHPALEDAGKRLDQFLAASLNHVSRVRVQQLIESKKVLGMGTWPKLRFAFAAASALTCWSRQRDPRCGRLPNPYLSTSFMRTMI